MTSGAVNFRIAVEGADPARREFERTGAAAEQLGARVGRTQREMADGFAPVSRELSGMRELLTSLVSVAGLTVLVSQLIQAADAVTRLDNQLKLATGSAGAASKAYTDLFRVAQASRVSFTELGTTYASIARAGQQLGLSSDRLLTVTQAIGQAMAISGGSAASMNAALVQLGQGMSAGVLRGEELNSVMEQTPRLAQALADGLGVPIGQLRKLGEEGQLTSERVIDALVKSAPQLAREIAGSTVTVEQSFTLLGNAATYFVGEADKATGASGALASAISGIASGLSVVADFIKANQTTFGVVFGALAGASVIAGYAALKAALLALVPVFGAITVAMGPISVTALGIAAAIGAVVAGVNALSGTEFALRNKLKALEGGDSVYGPRGREREAEIERLRAQLGEKAAARAAPTPVNDVRRVEAQLQTAETVRREAELSRLAELRAKVAGVDKDYIKTVQDLAAAVARGDMTAREYEQTVRRLAGATAAGREASQAAAKAGREGAQEQERLSKLLNVASGVEAGWAENVSLLARARDAGRISQEAYNGALQNLIDRQPAVKASAEEQARLLAQTNRLYQAAEQEVDAYLDAQRGAYRQDAEAAERAAEQAEDEVKLYGRLRSEVAAVTLEKLRARQAGLDPDDANRATLERQIQAQERLVRALQGGEVQAANRRAAEQAAADWKRTSDDIERSLTDALMRGFESGRGFLDSLIETVKNAFKTLAVRVLVQPVVGAISGFLGAPALAGPAGSPLGAVGQAAQSVEGLSNLGSIARGFQTFLGSASTFFGTGPGSLVGNIGLKINGFGNAIGSDGLAGFGADMFGATPGSAGGMAGAVGSYVAPALIGRLVGNAVSGGYSASGSGSRAINVGTAVGAIFGPIGAGIGAALGGVFNRAFGRKAPEDRGSGLTGRVSERGFDGLTYRDWFQKGGTFRSDRSGRELGELTRQLDDNIDLSIGALYTTTSAYAEALGLPVQAVRNYSGQLVVAWGATEVDSKKALEDAITGFGEQLAGVFERELKPLQRAGETLQQTLQRLAGLEVFSRNLAQLGTVFARVANLAVDAREQMIGLAGGMESLSQNALGFVQNYYSRDEIAGLKAREIQGVLGGIGVRQDFTGADALGQFRALVEGTDVSSEAGRQQLATLLSIQGQFAEIAQYLGESGNTLGSTAQLAPAAGQLQSMFGAGSQAQVDAINAAGTATVQAVNEVADILRNLPGQSTGLQRFFDATQIQGDSSRVGPAPRAGEVNGGNLYFGSDGG